MTIDVTRLRADLFPTPGAASGTPAPANAAKAAFRAAAEAMPAAAAAPPVAAPAIGAVPEIRAVLGPPEVQIAALLSLRSDLARRDDPIGRSAAAALDDELANQFVLIGHINSLIE